MHGHHYLALGYSFFQTLILMVLIFLVNHYTLHEGKKIIQAIQTLEKTINVFLQKHVETACENASCLSVMV